VHPPAEALGSFVAARRRLIKTEQRMKHKGVSAFRDTKNNKSNAGLRGGGDGFFAQVYPAPPASSGSSCSGLSTEESQYVTFDRRSYRDDGDMGNDRDVSVDGSCGCSDVISDGLADLVGTRVPKGEKIDAQGESWVDQEAEDSGACRSDISEELGARYICKGEISLPLVLLSVTWIMHIAISLPDIDFLPYTRRGLG
jgi:hypothetical protein